MSSSNKDEISLQDVARIIRSWWKYLLLQWKLILFIGAIWALVGIAYTWFQKPVYTAELTFAAENNHTSSLGTYAGIAAQFGVDLWGGSESVFEGDNLMYLMSSKKLIKKTLMTTTEIEKVNDLLINYYLSIRDIEEWLRKNGIAKKIRFNREGDAYSRERDSLVQEICKQIDKSLEIKKVDKKSNIISVRFENHDELFAKIFVEELVNNVIQYYTDYKIKKTRQNVLILQHQADSVKNLINDNIVDIAVSSDLNVNPTRQIVRTGIQRKQVDAQVNGALYTELVKNLELSKMGLRKETPLIQVIDTPTFPLEKRKMGGFTAALLFGFIGTFLAIVFFTFKKPFS